MAAPHELGRWAETLAATYLRRQGWRVLHRNWRFHHKELDLVVERGGLVAFVEVKARASGGWGHALQAITAAKRRDLAVAARGWIAEHGRPFHSFRFDAVVVVRGPSGTRVEHVEDAWRL
ncbi:MAG TPA: YraN family protein [Longimicrobiales bacterium]|nr:YraN family protein [Longimicrobiales bacterium]